MLSKSLYGKGIVKPKSQCINHNNPILGKGCVFGIISGKTGTGKTWLLLDILPNFTSKTKYIIICTKITNNTAHDSIETYCEKAKIKFYKYHDVEDAKEGCEKIINKKSEDDHVVFIFDDFLPLKKSETPEALLAITVFSWCRNYSCSALILTQKYTFVNTQIRVNSNIRWVFQTDSVHSLRSIADDCSSTFYQKEFKFMDVYNEFIVKDIHNYMIVKTTPQIIAVVVLDNNEESKFIQLYPEKTKQTAQGFGGRIRSPEGYKKLGPKLGMSKKAELYKIAKQFGYPSDRFKIDTIQDMVDFIKEASAKGEKNAGNTATEIDDIIKKNSVVYSRIHFTDAIKRYIKKPTANNAATIGKIGNLLIDEGKISEKYFESVLEKFNLQDLFEQIE